jgi:glycine dehydrogenase subunit 1
MRYLPLTEVDRKAMLAKIGAPSVESLYGDVPAKALLKSPVDLPLHMGELEVERSISKLAAKNLGTGSNPSFLGAGAYRHHVPAAVDHLIQRGEFLTSYTPYQPEVTQGTLQYLFEFQTQVALLTGMDVANASMYDGATATVEAAMMANRVTRRKKAVLSGGLHPHYREVIEPDGAHRQGNLLRCRAVSELLRQSARSHQARRNRACRGCAADRRGDRDRLAGFGDAAGRDGRGCGDGGGPVDR